MFPRMVIAFSASTGMMFGMMMLGVPVILSAVGGAVMFGILFINELSRM